MAALQRRSGSGRQCRCALTDSEHAALQRVSRAGQGRSVGIFLREQKHLNFVGVGGGKCPENNNFPSFQSPESQETSETWREATIFGTKYLEDEKK